jgi:hypothetical protein
VERADISCVVVARQAAYALTHLVCRFVGESHAQYAARHYADLVNKVCKAVRERPGFTGARPCYHTYKAFCCACRLPLALIQAFEYAYHSKTAFSNLIIQFYHIVSPKHRLHYCF